MALREALTTIMDEYLSAKQESMEGHPLITKMRERISEIQALVDQMGHPKIRVKWSPGIGGWSHVPWIAFLHKDETNTTQQGIYPVYLFHRDMTFVDLSLNQGFTDIKKRFPAKRRREVLQSRAKKIVAVAPENLRSGWITGERDYGRGKSSSGLIWGYSFGNILAKEYRKGQIPDEQALVDDLQRMLDLYQHILDNKPADLDESVMEQEEGQVAVQPVGQPHMARLHELRDRTQEAGLVYPDPLLVSLLVGLSCQPFTLLAGPTGTGKTQLATALEKLPGYEIGFVEVEGGWLDSASAFGYISPVTQEFVPGPVLLQLLNVLSTQGDEDAGHPVLVLDELNVSPAHVYLAPLLSVLERAFSEGRPRFLTVAQGGLSDQIRQAFEAASKKHPLLEIEESDPFYRLALAIPPSLRVVGTLNFDASTEDLAPKLVGRSFVVWFEHPAVQEDLSVVPQTVYETDKTKEPEKEFAKAVRVLADHRLHVSTRAVARARRAFTEAGGKDIGLVDVLLSGLVLPQFQTLTDEHPLVRSPPEFLDDLPNGFFKERLTRMRQQIQSEGMTSVWLVA